MSTEHKGNMIRDIPDGEMLKDKVAEGELLVSEGPKGGKLWKKKVTINEEEKGSKVLNETFCARCK